MTKIGSPGGPIKPSIPEFESEKPSPNIKEALPDKIMPQTANPGGATDAKGILNSQGELMKIKLQENLKTAGDAGTAIPEKWSPAPHPSAPLHPGTAPADKYGPRLHPAGTAPAEKWSPTSDPSASEHPVMRPPSSPPHPDLETPVTSAPPSKLANDKPAARLAEEAEKKK